MGVPVFWKGGVLGENLPTLSPPGGGYSGLGKPLFRSEELPLISPGKIGDYYSLRKDACVASTQAMGRAL